jgi:hypothetical protein
MENKENTSAANEGKKKLSKEERINARQQQKVCQSFSLFLIYVIRHFKTTIKIAFNLIAS